MDTVSLFSVMNVVLLVAGIAIGVLVGHFASPALSESKRLRGQLDQTVREFEEYRTSVGAHFRKTAELVGQMTKSYAAVYDHLAGGARRFSDDLSGSDKIPFSPLPGELAAPAEAAPAPAPEIEVAATADADEPAAAEGQAPGAEPGGMQETREV